MMMAGPEKKSTYKENAYMDDSKQDWWELSLASKLKTGETARQRLSTVGAAILLKLAN